MSLSLFILVLLMNVWIFLFFISSNVPCKLLSWNLGYLLCVVFYRYCARLFGRAISIHCLLSKIFSDCSCESFFLTIIRISHSVIPSCNAIICAVYSFLNEAYVKIWVFSLPSMVILYDYSDICYLFWPQLDLKENSLCSTFFSAVDKGPLGPYKVWFRFCYVTFSLLTFVIITAYLSFLCKILLCGLTNTM